MTFNKIIISIIISTIAVSCKPKFNVPDPETGNIDVSNYVALGSSMTAGYSNGALYYDAQQNSYANILAEQFKLIGSSEFKIPNVSQSSIGCGNANNAPSILGNRTDCQGTVSLGPVKVATQGDASIFTNIYSIQGPFNNMGVPDAKVIDIAVNSYTNSFYQQRMASSSSSSILSDAVAKKPTFFSVNLGLNDILNYALKGGVSDNITPIAGPIGVGFEASINNIINQLMANGAKGIVANIPSIKSMAYFNTIAYNALKLDSSKCSSLNIYYALADTTISSFQVGNNPFIIKDASQPSGFRKAVEGEYILLSAPLDSIKCNNMGSLVPIPNRHVLTLSEIASIESAINNYNTILKNLANTKGLAFVDVNSFFSKIKSGFIYNGVTVNAAFVSGGAYSLDGLNLTARGNALLANEFIKAINSNYSSSIPEVDAMKYPAVTFP